MHEIDISDSESSDESSSDSSSDEDGTSLSSASVAETKDAPKVDKQPKKDDPTFVVTLVRTLKVLLTSFADCLFLSKIVFVF